MVDPLYVQNQYRFGKPGETAKKKGRKMPKASFSRLPFAACRARSLHVGISAAVEEA